MSILRSLLKLLVGRGVYKSYSQFGEDLIIRPFTLEKKGFYVDVGCYHPILYSNTYRLYGRGWKGIVIDPNIRLKRLFRFFRPRDTFIQAGVGVTGQKTYFEFDDGAYNTFDTELVNSYEKRAKLIRSYPVQLLPLRDILAGVTHIDVMNIDVEGLDLEVLKTHDWQILPKVIIIEEMPGSEAHDFLIEKGYSLVGLTKLNSIFLHDSNRK